MGEAFALSAALCFGVTHFVCGVLAKRSDGVTVALYGQISGTIASVPLLWLGSSSPGALGWGALSGLGTAAGIGCLYLAMGRGAVSIAAPASDLGAAVLPVLVGIVFLAERPAVFALVGMVAALPAIYLVSRGKETGASDLSSLGLALLAGVGLGTHFVAIGAIGPHDGFAPIVVSRLVSVLPLAFLAAVRSKLTMPAKPMVGAAAAGVVGTLATVLYFVATRSELVATAAVLSALYPAIPVVLALVFLRERISRRQVAGLLCAGAAIGLIAASGN
ncbi:DMT family transporter [Fodinicola acaciae]|uniref:DMT family transporter n=1 Tax=Fodinicola acaciae TaxID=2681555 RepID=UPI0013D7AAA4|nr:DMT family transporter [Fodinicola acaciae]